MVRDMSYAAIAALLLQAASGTPVNPKSKVVSQSHPIGFDPNYVHIASVDDVVPEHIVVPLAKLATMNATSVPAFNPAGSSQLSKRLNGEDNRYQYSNAAEFPFRATGKIVWSSGVVCSGSLIGPRHVLSAKHCALTDGSTAIFYADYDNGPNAAGQGNVGQIYTAEQTGGACDTKNDFSVMIIDTRLGDSLGYFGAINPDSSRFNQPIFTTMGYPGDRDNTERPYRQDSNSLPVPFGSTQLDCDQTSGPIYSDTDSAGGQSGSPLWDDQSQVWGALSITIGYGDGTGGSGWASGTDMVNMILQARAEVA